MMGRSVVEALDELSDHSKASDMRKVLVLVIGIASGIAQAQTWCPPSAKWWYDYGTISGGTGYVLVEYVGDTTINAQQAQKLTAHVVGFDQNNQIPIDGFFPPLYTALIDDVVSLWTANGFDTLFHYGAVAGSQWEIAEGTNGYRIYTVTDTGTMVVDGLPLRWWSVSLPPFSNVESDTIVERMGTLNIYLRPSWVLAVTDPEIWSLRCYEDQEIQYTTGIAPSCDHVLGLDAAGVPDPSPSFYPNPTEDHLHVRIPSPSQGNLALLDITGQLLVGLQTTSADAVLSLAGMSSGVYLLRYNTVGMPPWTGRVVKQ